MTFILINSSYPMNVTQIDFKSAFTGKVVTNTPFSIVLDQADGSHVRIQGNGLSMDANGRLVAGTITQFQFAEANNNVAIYFNIADLELPAASFQNLCLSGSNASVLSVLFGGKTTISGGPKGDTIVGMGGNDYIYAQAGNDKVYGDAGNDTLTGGLGNDTLTGGTGRDQFLFDSKLGSRNVDRLADFKVKDDTVYLDHEIFKAAFAGEFAKKIKLSADAFWTGTAAHDADDRIIYDNAKGILWYDVDGDGAAAAVKFATLGRNLKMTVADFVIA